MNVDRTGTVAATVVFSVSLTWRRSARATLEQPTHLLVREASRRILASL